MSTTAATTSIPSDPRADLPDSLRPLTAMHDAMRRDARRLRAAIADDPDPVAAAHLSRWFGRVTSVILHHHRCEDEILWPAIERWVPDFVETAGHLVDDHHELDTALDSVTDGLGRLAGRGGHSATKADQFASADAAARLEAVLDRHLTAEEAAVIPAVRDAMPADAWAEAEEAINRTGTLRFAAFALPWVLDDADPWSAAVILDSLPLPFRLLQRLVWAPSYRRASMHG